MPDGSQGQEQLDDALAAYLDELDRYQALQGNLNKLLRDGFFQLAKAKLDSSSSALKLSARSFDLSAHHANLVLGAERVVDRLALSTDPRATLEQGQLPVKDSMHQFGAFPSPSLRNAKREFERAVELTARLAASKSHLDQLARDVRNARANMS